MDVTQVAKLANLTLTDQEFKSLSTQLSDTLNHISVINQLDTTNVVPTSQVTGLTNVTREDVVDTTRLLPPPPEKFYKVSAIFHE